jgi:hypothetical protein
MKQLLIKIIKIHTYFGYTYTATFVENIIIVHRYQTTIENFLAYN